MAKPNGAITPGDGALAAQATTDWGYAYFAFRLPFQPPHWDGARKASRHTATCALQMTIDAGTTMTDKWMFPGARPNRGKRALNISIPSTDVAGAKVASWETRTETNALTGYSTSQPPISARGDTLPNYCVGRLALQKDDANTAECLGIYLELSNTDDYTTPTPSGALAAELTDRATVRLYDADQPASSWHAQWVLIHTINKIMYESRQIWSVPL